MSAENSQTKSRKHETESNKRIPVRKGKNTKVWNSYLGYRLSFYQPIQPNLIYLSASSLQTVCSVTVTVVTKTSSAGWRVHVHEDKKKQQVTSKVLNEAKMMQKWQLKWKIFPFFHTCKSELFKFFLVFLFTQYLYCKVECLHLGA